MASFTIQRVMLVVRPACSATFRRGLHYHQQKASNSAFAAAMMSRSSTVMMSTAAVAVAVAGTVAASLFTTEEAACFWNPFGSSSSSSSSSGSNSSKKKSDSHQHGGADMHSSDETGSSSGSSPSESCSISSTSMKQKQRHILGQPVTPAAEELLKLIEQLPIEKAEVTVAPNVPPPISRQHPVRLVVDLFTTSEMKLLSATHKYPMWTYNGSVPGPFIRARVGDVMEVRYNNQDKDGVGHNIDFHAVTGPGGGAPCLMAEQGETKVGIFQLMQPGIVIF